MRGEGELGKGCQPLHRTIGFEVLPATLAEDLEESLRRGLETGVVFPRRGRSLDLFREAVGAAIREVESQQGMLLRQLLDPGPYEGPGKIPKAMRSKRLSDEETARAIRFIYGHMVNCFKGRLAELLAVGALASWTRDRVDEGTLPKGVQVFAADAVCPLVPGRAGTRLGADFHFLLPHGQSDGTGPLELLGVGEVKSYHESLAVLVGQMEKHIHRARAGLNVSDRRYPGERVQFPVPAEGGLYRIGIVPSRWRLPRTFRFEERGSRRFLHVDPPGPRREVDRAVQVGPRDWMITLRWSEEALGESGYRLSLWYMERLGEALYARGVPKEWSEMSPAQAGANAVKSALYYAGLRVRSLREQQRAIALYNVYGFGYALGMNFVDQRGRREMLWPEDLDELAADGVTRQGCRIR